MSGSVGKLAENPAEKSGDMKAHERMQALDSLHPDPSQANSILVGVTDTRRSEDLYVRNLILLRLRLVRGLCDAALLGLLPSEEAVRCIDEALREFGRPDDPPEVYDRQAA